METEPRLYLAYMLRMWQEQGQAGAVWRASLESPHTGERSGFPSLEALFDFLRQRIQLGAQGSQPPPGAAYEQGE